MDNARGGESTPDNKKDTIRLLQITDCHLSKDDDAELLGVKTLESLDAVLEQVAKDRREPDLLLLTGDLAQDGSVDAYRKLKQRMSVFSCPQNWFAGNHDAREAMSQVASHDQELCKVVRTGAWQFVLLDSLVPGKVHGKLEAKELDLLEQALSERPDLHTLVALHHHPVKIDSQWLDNIGLKNDQDFWAIIEKYQNVKAVLWGHIHQEVNGQRNGVKLMATPSTCIQFLPKSDEFAIDNIAPGYRWLELGADGSIETSIGRAESYEFNVDMASNGY